MAMTVSLLGVELNIAMTALILSLLSLLVGATSLYVTLRRNRSEAAASAPLLEGLIKRSMAIGSICTGLPSSFDRVPAMDILWRA